jgi:hypothetical protein
MIRINNYEWSGESTRLCLRYAQLKLGMQECILTAHPNVFQQINYTCNFSFNLLKSLKSKCFDFRLSPVHESWHISKNGPTIISLLESLSAENDNHLTHQDFTHKVLKSFWQRKGTFLSLIHTNQLLIDRGTKIMTWPQLKSSLGLSLSRRTPLFYTTIRHRLTDGRTSVINSNLLPLLHSPTAIFPTITLRPPSTDGRRKEWILTQRQNNVTIGKIIKKSPSSYCTYQH